MGASGEGLGAALDAALAWMRRYVVFPSEAAADASALWAAHTHAIEYADATGYLSVTSPDKGSGKTRLLEVLRLLTRGQPGIMITPTASTIYRGLAAQPEGPLILDELDTVFGDRSDKFEEVRAIINAGHRRGATVLRSVPGPHQTWEVKPFPVFGPRVLSGIGRLPGTIADRSIPIRMRKRKRSEVVERFRQAHAEREAEPLYDALVDAIAATPPSREADVPDALPDRAQDAWEPLLAIADAAGGNWPTRARRAAIALQGDREDEESMGVRLLGDCRKAFGKADRLATVRLIVILGFDEESPWANERDPLTPERLARHLRPFGIRSTEMKINDKNVRGYRREWFVDAWERYLAPSEAEPSDSATPRTDPLPRYPDRAEGSGVAGSTEGSGLGTADRPICLCGKPKVQARPDRWVCTNPFHGLTPPSESGQASGWSTDA